MIQIKSDPFAHNRPWFTKLTSASDKALTPDQTRFGQQLLAGSIPFTHASHVEWFDVGSEQIDWSGGHHQHQEWRAQLNRLFQLLQLAYCYAATDDEAYPEIAKAQILDWIRAHPCHEFSLAPYDNTLNLAIRVGNSHFPGWVGLLEVFQRSPHFDSTTSATIIESAAAQLNYLQQNLTPIGNWRIAQGDCLMYCGRILAEHPDAANWRTCGSEIINEAARLQILEDGAHQERNPHYHRWMTSVFSTYWTLAQNEPDCGLKIKTSTVRKMLRYAIATSAPDGFECGLHDTHQCAQDDWGHKSEYPLQMGFDLASMVQSFLDTSKEASSKLDALDTYFASAGQAFFRSDATADAQYLVFDASTWGGGHCHLSRNGIEFSAFGQRMLRDPGILSYEASDPMMAYGKSTAAHNTVNLNGWNQSSANPQNTWASYGLQRACASSEYEGGYWSGPFTWRFTEGVGDGLCASHHRTVYWHKERFLVIIDSVMRTPRNIPESEPIFLECNFQFDRCQLEIAADNAYAVARFKESCLHAYLASAPANTRLLHYEGTHKPSRGWHPAADGLAPSPMLSIRVDPVEGNYIDLVTVLVPSRGQEAPGLRTEFSHPEPNRTSAVELHWPDGSQDRLEWSFRCQQELGTREGRHIASPLLHKWQQAKGEKVSVEVGANGITEC